MRYIFTLKSALTILLMMFCCTMKAETVRYTTDDGFEYSLDTETREATLIIYYNKNATKVVIPESVTYENKIYKVTSLEETCFVGRHSLMSIAIPSSVTSLGAYCFFDCSSLTSINIPSSVKSLGDGCFADCSSLTSINIPSSVKSLGNGCFMECPSLKTVISKMENVISDKNLFYGDTPISSATLYVPANLLAAYKSISPWSDFGEIIPLGDSNSNGTVNIADAVNIANYAVGNDVENFCFVAADVNTDGEITVADASGTVTMILAMPVQGSRLGVRSLSATKPDGADCLRVNDYSATAGEIAEVSISLDNSIDYVALQADIILPEGLALQSVAGGIRAAGHSLMIRQIDSRRVRVVLFDPGNSDFIDSRESLLELKVKANSNEAGDIVIENIIASDAAANEYRLASADGHSNVVTGTDRVPSENVRVEAADGSINIYNATGSTIAIYGADGRVLARFVAKNEAEQYKTASGLYIVAVGNRMVKVLVK